MKPPTTLPLNPSMNHVQSFCEEAGRVLSNISFGDGTGNSSEQNVDGYYVNGVTNAIVDTDTVYNHKLGRIPVGWMVVDKDKAGTMYKTAATATTITLRCNVIAMNFRVLVF